MRETFWGSFLIHWLTVANLMQEANRSENGAGLSQSSERR